MAEFNNRRKKKICMMCAGKPLVDYKDPETLKRYINEKGKIQSRRSTGNCALHQRLTSRQIKRARDIALLPYCR